MEARALKKFITGIVIGVIAGIYATRTFGISTDSITVIYPNIVLFSITFSIFLGMMVSTYEATNYGLGTPSRILGHLFSTLTLGLLGAVLSSIFFARYFTATDSSLGRFYLYLAGRFIIPLIMLFFLLLFDLIRALIALFGMFASFFLFGSLLPGLEPSDQMVLRPFFAFVALVFILLMLIEPFWDDNKTKNEVGLLFIWSIFSSVAISLYLLDDTPVYLITDLQGIVNKLAYVLSFSFLLSLALLGTSFGNSRVTGLEFFEFTLPFVLPPLLVPLFSFFAFSFFFAGLFSSYAIFSLKTLSRKISRELNLIGYLKPFLMEISTKNLSEEFITNISPRPEYKEQSKSAIINEISAGISVDGTDFKELTESTLRVIIKNTLFKAMVGELIIEIKGIFFKTFDVNIKFNESAEFPITFTPKKQGIYLS